MSSQQNVTKALQIAGNNGRYQTIALGLSCIIFFFDLYLILGNSFYFMDPTFKCDETNEIVDEKIACAKIQKCSVYNDFTITNYLGLYCARQGERELIQSLLSIGSLLGLITMNFLSDIKGRKFALIGSLCIGLLSAFLTLVGTYSKTIPVLIFSSILSGFGGYSLIIICYIIAGDVCEQNLRQKGTLYMNLSYSLGLASFCVCYKWLNQWYNILVLVVLIPFIGITCICILLLVESPNYYLCNIGDKQKCIDSLTTIALYNNKKDKQIKQIQQIISGTNLESKIESNITNLEAKQDKQQKSVFKILRQWKFLKIIILVAITECGGNLFFYGIEFAIDDIGFDFGIDNLVLGSTQIVITIIMTLYVNQLKRKKTLIIAYLLTVLTGFIFVIPGIKNSDVFQTLLIIAIRALTSVGYFMIVMIQTQSFPLEIHSIGAGSIEALAQLGSFAAPLIIDFAVNQGLSKMATMGVVLFFCIIPIYFVQEPRSRHQKEESMITAPNSQISQPTQTLMNSDVNQ